MKAYQFSIPDDPQIDGVLSFRRADGEVLLNAIKPLDDGGWPRVFVEPGRYQICEHFPDEEPERWRDIEFVAPDPGPCRVAALEERVEALEKLVNQLLEARHPSEAMLDELETVKTKLDDRPADPLEISNGPPEAIADLFDPNLTARQNQEVLQQKYAQHMSEHYRLRDYGDQNSKSQAQRHLEKAERLDSGIKWNRARLAEVI